LRPGLVVIERERDGLDAERGEPPEELRSCSGPSEGGNVRETMGAQLMEIEDALDEHEVAPQIG
jgi:hypothetical protein